MRKRHCLHIELSKFHFRIICNDANIMETIVSSKEIRAPGRPVRFRFLKYLCPSESNRNGGHVMNGHKYLLPLAICGALAIAACSSANKDWATASAQNTVASYQAFLSKHAGDQHANDARTRIAALQDDSAWTTAQSGNSLDSYRKYLVAEPNGTHSQAARDQVSGLERASAWRSAQSDGSAAALQAFLQKYPQGPEADQARQKLATLSAGYRAELGTFRDERAAKRRRSQLQARFSTLLKEIHVVSPDSSNKRYRVISGLMGHHDVDVACASLKRDHQTCEIVSAKQGST